MRLDRLEISGFKSFPDRADVAFDVGVTAIVGPNGCGKSNLVDAITWVLGEQSARSLRGERMEDVIFSGSDARKATAAAEVRLRLSGLPGDAARRAVMKREGLDVAVAPGESTAPQPEQIELPAVDTRDVEIARRLYRSGESEYLIDGEGCRLRDVQDLLMDAGVGVKGYAVIEQGKIGQILSAKPTERRQLIEEAAGVTKYKSRRRAAELKLEAAQQNLTRVDDIIFEIEKQRAALKRQAAKARRYRRLREELRRWEKTLFAQRYRALIDQIDAAHERLAAARERETAATAQVTETERQLAEQRAALVRADERLRDVRDRVHAKERENDRREQQLTFDRQQIGELVRVSEEVAADIAVLDARRGPARQERESRQEAAAQAAKDRLEAERVLGDLEAHARSAEQSLATLEHGVEDARSQLYSSQNTIVTLQYAIERAQDGRARLADTIQRLEAESADARIEGERLRAEHADARRRLEAARAAIESLRAARGTYETTLMAARAVQQQHMEQLRAHERDLAALDARLRSLVEMDAHREGYGDAARLVLSESGHFVQHGSVADYLEVDPDAERVVEALIGDLLECVIVPTLDDAKRGLAYVRERNAGRIGFLVADGPHSVELPPAAPGTHPAAALVRVSGPHREAIRDALREMWIADTPEIARAVSAQRPGGAVATRAGDVYRLGRLVHGGTRTEARGILATKREIKELRGRLTGDQDTVALLGRDTVTLADSIADTDRQLIQASAGIHDQEKSAVALELQVERTQAEIDRLARKDDQIANERRQADEERRALEQRESEAREEITRLDTDRDRWQAQLSEAQRSLGGARDSAAEALRNAADAKVRHAALLERATGLESDVKRADEVIHELEERITQRFDEQQRARDRHQQLENAVAEGERQRVEDAGVLAALRSEFRDAEGNAQEHQHHVETREQAAHAARALLDDVRVHVSECEVARVTVEGDLNHLRSTCVETLQMTLEEVSAEVETLDASGQAMDAVVAEADDPDADSDQAADTGESVVVEGADPSAVPAAAMTVEETIASLRTKIERLGPVNMMAIEQFDELEQRHTFLSAQRTDLVDAIAVTGEAIKRIDRTTRERFSEAFAAINQYFEETFTTLFGGGRAGLVLLDDSDLLESGIDIIAQPPGKRLQNVQLLSGGEKALSAMALMFAIFRYRPSPFCLLDEIDAPLDDANIGRFIEMLRGMQKNTQFILVTHHRKTMEIADRLYGVTMEEPGVSKLISLRLN